MLDLLEELDARVTFFPIAARAWANPNLIRRMLAGGHTVGVHCDRHVRHSEQDRESVSADTGRAVQVLRALDAEPRLWRTPWGEEASFSAAVAQEHGLCIVGWTHDTHDWRGDRATTMLEAAQSALHDGAVVLSHDGLGPGAQRTTTLQTLEFARLLAAQARRQGLTLEAL